MKKLNAGFTLIEFVVGVALVAVALGMVGVARQKREAVRKQFQESIEQAEQERVKVEEEAKVTPRKEPETATKEDIAATSLPKSKKLEMSRGNVPGLETSDLPDADEHDTDKLVTKSQEGPRTSDQATSVPFQQSDLCFPGSPFPLCAIPGFSEDWYLHAQEQEQQQLNEAYYYQQQQQQMFDPNQFMQDPYQQFNPALQDLYQQTFPGLYQQFFPGY